ncbi:MAG: tRNA 2-thiouridine(34) synthase MnmA [Legionellales bacterium]|nr:tRNA 2-thiouridine(34) synthase MnmA [Legionellales bacterium]
MNQNNLPKTIIGLSGGVDSAVSAYLLKAQGYPVEAVFMRNWQEDDEHCPATQDLNDARAVCARLDIPLHTVSFAREYWDKVFSYFLDEYQAGRTPNPDILCNQEIKFRAFLEYALNELQAEKIATGHYASNQWLNNEWHLQQASDLNKDQTYFLYTLQQQQLQYSLFPLANMKKPEVRQLAQQLNLANFAKKDSTGICFIGERKFKDFLQQYLLAQPGNIRDDAGNIIGMHQGLMFYTIGQRQGLHIGGRKHASEEPWYVLEKNISTNELIVGQGHHHPALFHTRLIAKQLCWVSPSPPPANYSCQAKIRYRQEHQDCIIQSIDPLKIAVQFTQPQRAITTGQSIVFYQGNECLGGGIICDKLS